MSHPDPLKVFFEAGDAPASDPAFRVSVMAVIARQRMLREWVKRFAMTMVLIAALFLLKPVLDILQTSFLEISFEVYAALALVAVLAFAGQFYISHTFRFRLSRVFSF